MKLRVENLANGNVRALGKVWPAETELSAWSIEKIDSLPNRKGSPGSMPMLRLRFSTNLKVTSN
jgi:hypothetical protein